MTDHAPGIFLASTLAEITAGIGALFLSRRSGEGYGVVDSRRVLLAILASVFVLIAKNAVLRPFGLDAFGSMHTIYLYLVVVLPVLGAIVLLAALLPRGLPLSRRVEKVPVALAFLSLGGACAGIYASFVEPSRLQIEEARVPVDSKREGDRPLRIGVVADLQTDHVTDYEREAIEAVVRLAPDVILLPGDFFQGSEARLQRELGALRGLVAHLHAPGGVYFVQGNTDGGRASLDAIFSGSDVEILENEIRRIEVAGRKLAIGGISLGRSAAGDDVIQTLESSTGDDDIRILLSHYPDSVLGLGENSRIDLVIAGHTHGGQVVVPFYGPPITLSSVPRSVGAGGLHDLGGRRIYVSRGVGLERAQAPRIRFFCSPEISLLTIVDEESR